MSDTKKIEIYYLIMIDILLIVFIKYTAQMYDTNMITNMLYHTVIASIVTCISTNLTSLFCLITIWFYKLYDHAFPEKENCVKLVGTIRVSNYGIKTKFPQEYHAILSSLVKKNTNLYDITFLSDHQEEIFRSLDKNQTMKDFNFSVNTNKKIIFEEDIYVTFYEDKHQEDMEDKISNIKYLTMKISSNKYKIHELFQIINKLTKTYVDETQKYIDDGVIYYYDIEYQGKKITKMDGKQESNDTGIIKWNKNIFTTFKTFNNIFFNDKDILIKKLNYFLNNEDIYKRKGIPYNLGLLFYGNPGCGKTSCIKAISKFTKRHVIEINLRQIKTCTEFVKIFNNDEINGKYIPHVKKIIVLEDIDCMIDIVKSRENADHNNNKNMNNKESDDNSNILNLLLKNKKKFYQCDDENEDDKLTLSCILNTIDGVLENYGRILIITTNYVKLLDKALIRPGRIDAKINFTTCTVQMYYDIIENYYDTKLRKNIPFIDLEYSPAEVLEICSLYDDNIQTSIKKLTKKKIINDDL